MGSGFAKRKKQARQLQSQLYGMQEELAQREATGSAANGLVSITLSGDYAMKNVKIDPQCVDPEDVEGLEDLVRAAYQHAYEELKKYETEGLPGLGQFFPGVK